MGWIVSEAVDVEGPDIAAGIRFSSDLGAFIYHLPFIS